MSIAFPARLCRFVRRCALCAAMILLVGRLALAEGLIASSETDWPQWRGRTRDGISPETGLLAAWPTGGPRLLWKQMGLGTGWSSPIISGERLFITGDVGDELIVFAFDREGRLLWRTPNGQAWTGSYPGARASCCYSEGRVYHLNAHGRLACLDATDGTPVWTAEILERFDGKNITWALSESVLVDESRVIVTPGGTRALMAALDKGTGETVWMTPPLPEERTSHCSPILFELHGRRTIASCSAAHGFGVDADDGTLLWTVPLKNQFGVNVATPIYAAGSIFFVTPYGELGRLYRLRHEGAQFTPEEIWTSRLDSVTGGGVLVDGTLYAAGYRRNKWWMALDWQTGEMTSQLKDLTTGAAIYAEGRLYCLDEQGGVGLVAPERDGLQLAGTFRLVTDRVNDAWAHPVLLDGRLYLRYHDALFCYDVAAPPPP
ncbi:MAG: PQQ-binding-like beta-propeller repeat protein [Pirellulaceae bacterium]